MREFATLSRVLPGLMAAAYLLLLPWETLPAQEQASPTPEKKAVRITFLPPPLEGTISLGVYTLEGKLVRVLASEATEEKFTIGLNGLIIDWDGKDDAGKILPAGKYFLRGFAVGDLGIEGIAFHGNDWMVADESPRIRDLSELRFAAGELLIAGMAANGELVLIHFDPASGRPSFERVLAGNHAFSSPAAAELALSARRGGNTSASAAGEEKTGGAWKIETIGEGAAARRVVRQRAGNEILRELEIPSGDPQPISVAAAAERDEIYLLERGPAQVRLRGLRLKGIIDGESEKKVSRWEIFLTKNIWKNDTFMEFAPQFRRDPPFLPEEKVKVRLVSNPLLQVKIATLPLVAAIDQAGSFLSSPDGLPLVHLTTTPNLKWAVLGRGPGNQALTVLQSDGAVVEEFRMNTPANIMAFEAGGYEWNGAVK
jgi:hypothetical protein